MPSNRMLLIPAAVLWSFGLAAAQTTTPTVTVLASTNLTFRARFAFPAPALESVSAANQRWTRVSIHGLTAGGAAGAPEIFRFRRFVGLPAGAIPELVTARPTISQTLAVNLYPYQPLEQESSPLVDQYTNRVPPPELFRGAPFTVDAQAYSLNAAFPEAPCTVAPVGHSRDLNVAQVECAAGQYNPVTKVLTLFQSVDFEIRFRGGSGTFLTSASLNPFERMTHASVMNGSIISKYVARTARHLSCAGEELLILTHPKYDAAANDLAAWKNAHGVLANVFDVNDGAGPGPDTKEQIDAFIDSRYAKCSVRPSYVLLFGDSDDIPTFDLQRNLYPAGIVVPSDFPYATYGAPPTAQVVLPDFAVGRIAVNSLAQAQTVVDKIKQYEGSPSLNPSYFGSISIASFFQCCNANDPLSGVEDGRSFILNAEYLKGELEGHAFVVDRIYDKGTSHNPEYKGDPTPRYFGNSTPLPPDLAPGSGFAWKGSTTDITNAFNEGRLFMFHVDHGWSQGWVDPAFSTAALSSLTNSTMQPVVFDFDCSSGDFEDASFTEQIVRLASGGAVAAFGFTSMSNTMYDRPLIEGTLDAVWPDTISTYGTNDSLTRLGDIFDHSKSYMATVMDNPQKQSNTVNHIRLYHLFGDPSMQVWTGYPRPLTLTIKANPLPSFIDIHYDEDGAVVTALQRSAGGYVPIGRGVVRNGSAQLTYIVQPQAGIPIQYTAGRSNALAVALVAQ